MLCLHVLSAPSFSLNNVLNKNQYLFKILAMINKMHIAVYDFWMFGAYCVSCCGFNENWAVNSCRIYVVRIKYLLIKSCTSVFAIHWNIKY